MKIKKALTFTEAWDNLNGDVLNEDVETRHYSDLTDALRYDKDYANIRDNSSLSFKDVLLKLRDNYLKAETEEDQDAALDLLTKRLKSFLNGNRWKILLKNIDNYGGYTMVSGQDFALDLLIMILEPDVKIELASVLAAADDF